MLPLLPPLLSQAKLGTKRYVHSSSSSSTLCQPGWTLIHRITSRPSPEGFARFLSQVKRLSSGNFGTVYLCLDRMTGEEVAIKYQLRNENVRTTAAARISRPLCYPRTGCSTAPQHSFMMLRHPCLLCADERVRLALSRARDHQPPQFQPPSRHPVQRGERDSQPLVHW